MYWRSRLKVELNWIFSEKGLKYFAGVGSSKSWTILVWSMVKDYVEITTVKIMYYHHWKYFYLLKNNFLRLNNRISEFLTFMKPRTSARTALFFSPTMCNCPAVLWHKRNNSINNGASDIFLSKEKIVIILILFTQKEYKINYNNIWYWVTTISNFKK